MNDAPSESESPAASAEAGSIAPSCAELTDLIACFDLDGNLEDRSPNRLVPTTSQGIVYEAGRSGRAARFSSGVGSFALFPADRVWNNPRFTAELWINPSRIPPAGSRAGLVDSQGRFAMFLHGDGKVHCRGGAVEALTTELVVGVFRHVSCTFSQSEVASFIDGRRVQVVVPTLAEGSSDAPTTIGANAPDGATDLFDGLLDSIRIFNVVRDEAAIARDAR